MQFRVELEMFLGPLDLLLYLVRKHELDVTDIPIAVVTDQFLSYITVLEQIDVAAVGDFLEMASTLIEIKSRMVLPGDDEVQEELEDPRQDLVRRLLAYKQYRDAASMLEERGRQWRERYPRVTVDLPGRTLPPHQQPIQEVELWDLVSAFGRVLREKCPGGSPERICYDETPIQVYMRRIDTRLRREGRLVFTALWDGVVHKSTVICMFLAVLELMRFHHARAAQSELFGEIWLEPGDEPLPEVLDITFDYEHQPADAAAGN